MAKVSWNLASKKLGASNTPKSSPTLLGNTKGSTNISYTPINPASAGIKGTASFVPPILDDPVPQAVANLTNTLVNTAFKYNERVDQVEADQAILDYKAQSRELFYGTQGGDGQFVGGYGTLEREAALAGHQQYNAQVEALSEKALAGRSKGVSAKMVLRIQQESSAAKERGVGHNNQQLKAYEQNVRFQEKQDILKDIELNGPAAFTNGTVDAALAKYDSLQEREANSKFLATEALYMTYNDTLSTQSKDTQDLTPAMTAYNAANAAFEEIRGTVSEPTENAMMHWLEGRKAVAERQAKSNLKANEERRAKEIGRDAPMYIADSLASGSIDTFDNGIAGYRSTIKNPETASKKIMGATKDAMKLMVNKAGGVTVADKKSLSSSLYDLMIEGSTALNPIEKMALEEYAKVDLPKQMEAQQNQIDLGALAVRDALMAESIRDGQTRQFNPNPPPDMTPANAEKWYAQTDSYKADRTMGPISGKTKVQAEGLLTVYKERLTSGEVLTPSEMGKVVTFTTENVYPPGTLAAFQEKNEKNKVTTSKKPSYMEEPAYKSTKKHIEESSYLLVGLPPEKPKNKANDKTKLEYAEANAEYKHAVRTARAEAILDLNSYRQDTLDKKQPFDYEQWWRLYTKINLNNGSVLTPSTAGGSSYLQEATNVEGGKLPTVTSDALYWLTGDEDTLPTIMD